MPIRGLTIGKPLIVDIYFELIIKILKRILSTFSLTNLFRPFGLGCVGGVFDVVVFAVFDEVGVGLFEREEYLFFFHKHYDSNTQSKLYR